MGLAGFIWLFPFDILQISKLKNHYPTIKSNQSMNLPEVSLEKYKPYGWTALKEVSPLALAAIIISEDSAFYQHNGIDTDQIKKAIEINLEKKRFVRGASTITQQVAKNVFLSHKKSIPRKIKELFLALWMEKELSKTKILEIYINIAEWGNGIYGIGPASRHYFGKSPSDLNAKEGAFLAMLLPSPKRYSNTIQRKGLTSFAEKRIEDILEKLEKSHHISIEDYYRELSEPLWVNL